MPSRLDSAFLSKLLVKHSSGVSVLAAPGKFPQYQASNEAIDKLLAVARQSFDNVVVDMGSRLDLTGTALFKDASSNLPGNPGRHSRTAQFESPHQRSSSPPAAPSLKS